MVKTLSKPMQTRRDERRAYWIEKNPAMWAYLNQEHSFSFLNEMRDNVQGAGMLSENQYAAVQRCMDRDAAWAEAKKAKKAEVTNAAPVDLSKIKAMFDAAVASGKKRPGYRAEGLHLTRAPDSGRNPGCIYVKDIESDAYLGKVLGGVFTPTGDGIRLGAVQKLAAIALDPLTAATRYGKQTGICSCCGRLLTNLLSVELGIGPICRGDWAL